MITHVLITLLIFYLCESSKLSGKDEDAAKEFMRNLNEEQAKRNYELSIANWAYTSNITKENLEATIQITTQNAIWLKEKWAQINSYPWKTYKSQDLRRQFEKYSILGVAALPQAKLEKIFHIVNYMQSIYSTAKICSFSNKKKCNLTLEPDLENLFINSNNPDELKYAWKQWRDATGKRMKHLFPHYISLANEAAIANNFTDVSEFWIHGYEDKNFKSEIKRLWIQLRPLYLQIHAYVRRKLREKYGVKIVSKDGYIPAHLLGNMWAQSWINIYKYIIPYPAVKSTDVTSELVAQKYTAIKIFKTAEEFFTSINMSAMPELFWKNSIFEKPSDREIVCHASAWDFSDSKDYRIKQCTRINSVDFATTHHEMGHIEYFLQYKNLPVVYRGGANAGFHEAVGDVISLSVSTDKHLHKIGLLKKYVDTTQTNINKLLEIGLSKIVFLPFAYIMDLWRWDVFKGKITPENYNSEWWKLRNEYQGIEAPVPRSNDDFDPGAKYHIVASVPYIRYFVSFVIQFQFHKALCIKAGQYEPNNPEKPLHKCDIYQSKEAGNALSNMLALGSSKPWQDAMETLTGGRTMDASALLEYFSPLQKWLEDENKKSGENIGWKT